jgi:4-hydroxy-3-methylbut-2-enyl diphosphate reductase
MPVTCPPEGTMEVIVAKSAGFCFGVKRAVEEVNRQITEGQKPVYTYGPIIHNEQVVNSLANRGVQVIGSEEELDRIHEGTIIIRSHGVSRRVYEKMQATGAHIVDATCPFVKKIHEIARASGEKDNRLVIAGDPDHPEVQGITGWTDGEVQVVKTAKELEENSGKTSKTEILVAQTTFNKKKFEDIVEIFEKKKAAS